MSENPTSSPPKWFTIVAIVALIWNLMGVIAYIMQVTMGEEAMADLSPEERALYVNAPAWATAAFAISVWGGALGSLALVLKKEWAFPVLSLSLVGILVQMYHSFFIANSMEVYGPGETIMPIMVIAIGFYLVWLARSAKARGWIS